MLKKTSPYISLSPKNICTIPKRLPLPSLHGADHNLPNGHLVHSTYHQALSAQSCPYFNTLGTYFLPSSYTGQLACDALFQCNVNICKWKAKHILCHLFRLVLCELTHADVTMFLQPHHLYTLLYIHCIWQMKGF